MLEKLLYTIRSGGTHDLAGLAAQLSTSQEMVAAMLEHLQRSGHIQPYQACDDACGGCGLKDGCKPGRSDGGGRLWQT